MKKVEWKKVTLPWKWILLGLFLALLSGVGQEVAFNWYSLMNGSKSGNFEVDNSTVAYKGAEVQEGMFVSKGKEMVLRVKLSGQYVNKLHYTYMSPYLNVDAKVEVHTKDGYGQDTVKVFQDKNSILRNFSVIRVNQVTDEVVLHFLAPSDGLVVSSIGFNDSASFSKMRFLFFAAAAVLIYLVVLGGKLASKRLEVLFLLLILPIGGLMILGFSPREAGWDEHIHFYRAYSLMYDLTGRDTMPVSEPVNTYMNGGMANEPFYFPRSQEENAQERVYGGVGFLEGTETVSQYQPTNGLHIYSIAYLPQTLMLAVGTLFHVPFWLLMAMGRAGNLAFYAFLCYLAIRHMKRGKGILFVIALLPTSVFLGATYSYDAFINGFMMLGMSYFFTELFETDRNVSRKNLAVFVLAVIAASMPKAVYIPLILLGLLLPAKRFSDQKELWVFRGLLAVALLALLLTFVLPAAGGGQGMPSDPRGGQTDAMAQLHLVLSHPISYLALAFRSIGENLTGFLFGQSVGGNLAYRGALKFGQWLCPFVLFVIFTERYGEAKEGLGLWQKLFIGVLLLEVIGLIWTALYLSFTPVGVPQINGVQARYYIPLLVPAYLALQVNEVKNVMKPEYYYRILAGGSLFFLLDGLWNGVIAMCF